MSKSKPYNRESIAHAFAHHESRGVLRTVSPPMHSRPRWRITLEGSSVGDALEMSEPEAYRACLLLAACEAHARAEQERFVRELSQRDGPICLDDDLEHEVALLRRVVRMAVNALPAESYTVEPIVAAAIKRAVDETRRSTLCGIHGDDTTSGRCMTCDVLLLHERLRLLETDGSETHRNAVVTLCERQPRLIAAVLTWAVTAGSEQ